MADILYDEPSAFETDANMIDQAPADPVTGAQANEFRAALKALNRVFQLAEGPPQPGMRSVVQFGGVADGATDNIDAFEKAAAVLQDNGGGYLLVPPSTHGFMWHGTFEIPAGVILKGIGPRSIVKPRPGVGQPGIRFQSGSHRGGIQDISILGVEGANQGIGIDCTRSQYLWLQRFNVWDYEVGLRFSDGVTSFTAYVTASQFEIARCYTGVQAYLHTNGCGLRDGRIFWSFNGGAGISLDVDSADVFSVQNMQIESMDLGLRARGETRLALRDVYFETGDPARNWSDVNCHPEAVVRLENIRAGSQAGLGVGNSLESITVWDEASIPFSGARRHYAAAAERNLLENGDFHRADGILDIPGWTTSGVAPDLEENTIDYISGGRAYDIAQNIDPNDGLTTSLVIPEILDYVTIMVRFKNLTSNGVFFSASSSGNVAQWRDPHPPDENQWRTAAFTLALAPSAAGLVSITLSADQTSAGGRLRLDEVWVVAGRTAAPARAHAHRIEYLPSPITLWQSNGVVANEVFGPIDLASQPGLGGAPRGVTGAVLRLRGRTEAGIAGQMRLTTVTPYLNIPNDVGEGITRLAITSDMVWHDKQIILRGTTVSGGLNFPSGVGFASRYACDVIGWMLPS